MMWTNLVYIQLKHYLTPIGWCLQEQEVEAEMVLYTNKGPHVDLHPAEVTLNDHFCIFIYSSLSLYYHFLNTL